MKSVKETGGCGASKVMGHGCNAICGEEFYGATFACDRCKLDALKQEVDSSKERANRAANDERKKYLPIVTKQAEQIKLLRKALEKFVPMDECGNGDFQYNEGSEYLGEEVMEALAATENKND